MLLSPRNPYEEFHKLFTDIPKDEFPINGNESRVCYRLLTIVDLYKENSLELMQLSSINKVSLVSSCSNTGAIRDDPCWISRENSSELIELSSINKASLV